MQSTFKDGPDIARIAALIGDPARANMLTALMTGQSLTAAELAAEAGVTKTTASAHLAKLTEGGLIRQRPQGRHKYFNLANDDVAKTLENLMGLAAGTGHLRTRTGPRDAALREARICYNHLAGDSGVQMCESLKAQGHIVCDQDTIALTQQGARFAEHFGIDLTELRTRRAPLCRPCLDWSARRTHLAGSLGRALLTQILNRGWARRQYGSRVVAFTPPGRAAFNTYFPGPR
ncbi:helix-turn-helix transcriptional regulator [Actibacterium sp. 188UL27-1]|uniref:ArsR/SmtB family transcription factor n=1 Tax=Actibacterium sp. 188UL27-1 TaxID=2786961 RepID=UPI00195C8939|nr:helix-turn-helix transcriptional regulator [Actibacterium sp. 188UL27-1]MBM7069258.1 helix-turn-helix transcriptional regulator [Actibacterium sp. 188UL27-1]